MRCCYKSIELRKMGRGELFGEQALLYDSSRTATVSAMGLTELLAIHKTHAGTLFGSILFRNTQKIALEKSPVLDNLDREQSEALLSKMKVVTYEDG